MITEFKIFEKLNIGKPRVGDYVIIQTNHKDPRLINFFENTITKIVGTKDLFGTLHYIVYFDNIPEELSEIFDSPFRSKIWRTEHHHFTIENIKYWSKNKEDLEYILAANKYNL